MRQAYFVAVVLSIYLYAAVYLPDGCRVRNARLSSLLEARDDRVLWTCDTDPDTSPYYSDVVIRFTYRVFNPNNRRLATAVDYGSACDNGRDESGTIPGLSGGSLEGTETVLELTGSTVSRINTNYPGCFYVRCDDSQGCAGVVVQSFTIDMQPPDQLPAIEECSFEFLSDAMQQGNSVVHRCNGSSLTGGTLRAQRIEEVSVQVSRDSAPLSVYLMQGSIGCQAARDGRLQLPIDLNASQPLPLVGGGSLPRAALLAPPLSQAVVTRSIPFQPSPPGGGTGPVGWCSPQDTPGLGEDVDCCLVLHCDDGAGNAGLCAADTALNFTASATAPPSPSPSPSSTPSSTPSATTTPAPTSTPTSTPGTSSTPTPTPAPTVPAGRTSCKCVCGLGQDARTAGYVLVETCAGCSPGLCAGQLPGLCPSAARAAATCIDPGAGGADDDDGGYGGPGGGGDDDGPGGNPGGGGGGGGGGGDEPDNGSNSNGALVAVIVSLSVVGVLMAGCFAGYYFKVIATRRPARGRDGTLEMPSAHPLYSSASAWKNGLEVSRSEEETKMRQKEMELAARRAEERREAMERKGPTGGRGAGDPSRQERIVQAAIKGGSRGRGHISSDGAPGRGPGSGKVSINPLVRASEGTKANTGPEPDGAFV